jgi:hypothetical protein
MLRVYKHYDLPLTLHGSAFVRSTLVYLVMAWFRHDRVAAERVAFSSYPGSVYSGDDFYVLSSGLVVQETTLGKFYRHLRSMRVLWRLCGSLLLSWIERDHAQASRTQS